MQNKPIFHKKSYFLDIINVFIAISWFFAYLSLLFKIRKNNNVIGLSLQTLVVLVVAECNHVAITLALSFHFGIVPELDFYLCDCTTAILSVATLLYILWDYYGIYEWEVDNFGVYISHYVLSLILPDGNKVISKGSDLFILKYHWFAIYFINIFISMVLFTLRRSNLPAFLSFWEAYMDGLSSIALLPQFHMFFNKRPRKIPHTLVQFVLFILLARFLMLWYWLLYPLFREVVIPGRVLHVSSEVLNVLILLNFVFYHIRLKVTTEKNTHLPI